MSLSALARLLFILACVLLGLSILVVTLYFYHSRRRSINYLAVTEPGELRYFIQKQVGTDGQLAGYECLLRQRQTDGRWRLPENLETLPLQRVISLLDRTFETLPDEPIDLAINLELTQVLSPEFDYFVRWAISKIEPMHLVVELRATSDWRVIDRPRVLRRIRAARANGMHLAIDDIGADQDYLDRIQWLLPEVDMLKASMPAFRKGEANEWLDLNLMFWRRLARELGIHLILLGVESDDDEALASQLDIQLQQGYRFGRPQDPTMERRASHDDTKSE